MPLDFSPLGPHWSSFCIMHTYLLTVLRIHTSYRKRSGCFSFTVPTPKPLLLQQVPQPSHLYELLFPAQPFLRSWGSNTVLVLFIAGSVYLIVWSCEGLWTLQKWEACLLAASPLPRIVRALTKHSGTSQTSWWDL